MKVGIKGNIKRIERKRLSSHIIEQILSLITSGRLKVGDKLPPEPVLMKLFGVGRNSLREAMGALSLTGVISVCPGRGAQITSSAETFLEKPFILKESKRQTKVEEIIETRLIIEEAATGLAAKRATEADISEIRNALAKHERVKKNAKKRIPTGLSFHLSIVKASHNSLLIKIYSQLQPLLRHWMEQEEPLESVDEINFGVDQHTEIFKAIEKKDAEKARLLVRKHLEYSFGLLASALHERRCELQAKDKKLNYIKRATPIS